MQRFRALARVSLIWERLWLLCAPILAVVGLFVALALMEAYSLLPGWLHVAVLIVFALAFSGTLWFAWRYWRIPVRQDIDRRLERDSKLPHRPISTLEDSLSGGAGDRRTAALWRAHRRRTELALRNLEIAWPRPGLPAHDRYALRGLVFLLLAIGIFVGGGDVWPRMARAMAPQFGAGDDVKAVLEAWINPPTYTAVAPVRLAEAAAKRDGTPQSEVRVPEGSELLARVYGGEGDARLKISGSGSHAFTRVDAFNQELKVILKKGEKLTVSQGDDALASWPLILLPDLKPTARVLSGVSQTKRGVLRLPYAANDDYGVVSARLKIRLAPAQEDTKAKAPAPLDDDVVPIDIDLPLGSITGGSSQKQVSDVSYHDLMAHPWAGRSVAMRIVAEDELGQTGASLEHVFVLPERDFVHPVARAIIEQRKLLSQGERARRRVALALRAIAAASDRYDEDVVVYLALRMAAARLRHDREKGAITPLRDLLWDTALRVEEGKLAFAERALREAQQALMDALQSDADNAEIERLMENLKQALDRFLQALAENALKKMQQQADMPELDENAELLQQDQLRRMLERAGELARMGAKDAARQLLQQLRDMLENLRADPRLARRGQQQAGAEALRELGELMQRQQELMDRTYRSAPKGAQQPGAQGGQQRSGRRGGQRGNLPPGFRGLSRQQEGLRGDLGNLMWRFGENMDQIPEAFGNAEKSMRDARDALRGGDANSALDSQSRAIDQLAEGLRQMLKDQVGDMQGYEEGLADGLFRFDPAGRPYQLGGWNTNRVKIPDESEMQRAREILDELRRRAGERKRPVEELDYIERLLRRF